MQHVPSARAFDRTNERIRLAHRPSMRGCQRCNETHGTCGSGGANGPEHTSRISPEGRKTGLVLSASNTGKWVNCDQNSVDDKPEGFVRQPEVGGNHLPKSARKLPGSHLLVGLRQFAASVKGHQESRFFLN